MTPRAKTLGAWKRRNIVVEDVLWRKIKERAFREERTVSEIIREAIKDYVGR